MIPPARCSLLVLALPLSAAGQAPHFPWLEFAAGARIHVIESGIPAAAVRYDGAGAGADLRVRLWRFTVRAEYGEARVAPATGTGFDLVEGSVALGGRPMRWLQVEIGPELRAYVRQTATERWVAWTARLTAEWRILEHRVHSWATVWGAFSADVNTSTAAGEGRGLAGGLRATIPGTPLQVRAGYRMDRLALADDTRRETAQQFFLDLAFLLR